MLRAALFVAILLAPTAAALLDPVAKVDGATREATRTLREATTRAGVDVDATLASAPAPPPPLLAEVEALVASMQVPVESVPILPPPAPQEDVIPDPFADRRDGRRSRDRVDAAPLEPTATSEDAIRPASRPEEPPLVQSTSSPAVATIAIGLTALVAGLASLYSRFHRRSVLASAPRAALHERIQASHGASVAELARELGMSRGAVVHHLQMLERHGLVVGRNDGLHRRYYGAGLASGSVRPPTPGEARALEVLAARGPLTQAELARELAVSRQAASEQVRRLARDGRVVPVEDAGQKRWLVARAPDGTSVEPDAS